MNYELVKSCMRIEDQPMLPEEHDIEDIFGILIPEIITPDQISGQERESGEILLLREILKTAILDLGSNNAEYRINSKQWLLNDCGEISLKMCLDALNVNISWFRVRVRKLLLNDPFGVDNKENKDYN